MSPWAGERAGDKRGTHAGSPRDFSPVAVRHLGDFRTAGDAATIAPHAVPNRNSAFRLLTSGLTEVLPVIPSPYGDDYLRTSLSTTSIIGTVAA